MDKIKFEKNAEILAAYVEEPKKELEATALETGSRQSSKADKV